MVIYHKAHLLMKFAYIFVQKIGHLTAEDHAFLRLKAKDLT